ncbi:MAG: hypothetical protein B7Z37_25655 [Verrucomicrobia bacterium 12-59-8]|nr:MAG: hypothetical protein B7Z37_25655 [Verrucomicrobia bacterium 12-59-8]
MNDQQIVKTLQWLSNRKDSVKTCTFLNEFMTSDDASEIIRLWLDQGFPAGMSQKDKVCALMTELENWADECTKNVLLLMTALQPIAGPLYLYDVCDAIGLWHHEIGLQMNSKSQNHDSTIAAQ